MSKARALLSLLFVVVGLVSWSACLLSAPESKEQKKIEEKCFEVILRITRKLINEWEEQNKLLWTCTTPQMDRVGQPAPTGYRMTHVVTVGLELIAISRTALSSKCVYPLFFPISRLSFWTLNLEPPTGKLTYVWKIQMKEILMTTYWLARFLPPLATLETFNKCDFFLFLFLCSFSLSSCSICDVWELMILSNTQTDSSSETVSADRSQRPLVTWRTSTICEFSLVFLFCDHQTP